MVLCPIQVRYIHASADPVQIHMLDIMFWDAEMLCVEQFNVRGCGTTGVYIFSTIWEYTSQLLETA